MTTVIGLRLNILAESSCAAARDVGAQLPPDSLGFVAVAVG